MRALIPLGMLVLQLAASARGYVYEGTESEYVPTGRCQVRPSITNVL